MPDFRIADTAPEHRKLRAAGLPAAGLWALAGAYSTRELTDGWVPRHWVQGWPAGTKHAAALVRVGLWQHERRDGIDGYRFHDWHDYQQEATQHIERKQQSRKRTARWRERRQRDGSGDASRDASRDGLGDALRDADVTASSSSSSSSLVVPLAGGSYETYADDLDPPDDQSEPDEPPGQPPDGGVTSGNGHPPDPSAARCARHADDPDPPPCRGCAAAREAAERDAVAARRAAAEAVSVEARRRAEDRRRAVAECRLCDDSGYAGGVVCDHDPGRAERAQRGVAAAKLALQVRRDSNELNVATSNELNTASRVDDDTETEHETDPRKDPR